MRRRAAARGCSWLCFLLTSHGKRGAAARRVVRAPSTNEPEEEARARYAEGGRLPGERAPSHADVRDQSSASAPQEGRRAPASPRRAQPAALHRHRGGRFSPSHLAPCACGPAPRPASAAPSPSPSTPTHHISIKTRAAARAPAAEPHHRARARRHARRSGVRSAATRSRRATTVPPASWHSHQAPSTPTPTTQ